MTRQNNAASIHKCPDAQVLVRACKAITKGLEIFANYGPKDKIRFFDNRRRRCHACGVGYSI